jgi:hypothetical protein
VEELAWKPFIDGYLQIRPAAADSLEFLWLFMILNCLLATEHMIGRSLEWGVAVASDDFVEEMVTFCERIESDVTRGQLCV